MQRRKRILLLAACLLILPQLISRINAQPSLIPPVAHGADTLAGFGGSPGTYEFFTQEAVSWKGDIGGIVSGETYWLYVINIDATGLTGPAGRQIKFNIQDADSGSSFKHLGISFSLDNQTAGGGDLLECYQSNGDGLSTHGLVPGELTTSDFDLRFSFTKDTDQDPWLVTPYYRLSGQTWTPFYDPPFTAATAFNFLAAKLVVAFDNPSGAAADGTIAFDNFFLVGPIQGPITDYYVDDAWSNLVAGDAVQFPGQNDIQVIGTNAFSSITEVFDLFVPSSAKTTINSLVITAPIFPTIHVAPGTYNESVFFTTPAKLLGSGSGDDPNIDTIIIPDESGEPAVQIDAQWANGTSVNPVVVQDVRLTGATGSGFDAAGLIVTENGISTNLAPAKERDLNSLSSLTTSQYLIFDNVTSVGNQGSGITFDHSGQLSNIDILNCNLLDNGEYGIHVSSSVSIFTDLDIIGCTVNSNGINGFTSGPQGSWGVGNVVIENSSFSGNGDSDEFGFYTGDISFYEFNGNATLHNVMVAGSEAHVGVLFMGLDNDGTSPAGTIALDTLNINGAYLEEKTGTGYGLAIENYSNVDGFSFNQVNIDIPTSGSSETANLFCSNVDGTLDINNTVFGGNAGQDIIDNANVDIDATAAIFTAATDNYAIENRVRHAIDIDNVGLVTWVPQNLFITPQSFVTPDTSADMSRAVNAASSQDTVNFSTGIFYDFPSTYIETDQVWRGADKVQTIVKASDDTDDEEDEAWFYIDEGVEFDVWNMTFDGNEHEIYEAFQHNGSGLFSNVCFNDIQWNASGPDYEGTAVNAIGTGAVHVKNCMFTEIGRRGVHYGGSGVDGSVFSGNTYTGKGFGDHIDIGLEIDNGSEISVKTSDMTGNSGVPQGLSLRSTGVRITTIGSSGTTVTIDSLDVFDSYHGVEIGADTLDQSFVVIKRSNLSENQTGIKAVAGLFLKVEKSSLHYNETAIDLDHMTVFDLDQVNIWQNEDGINVKKSFGEIDDSIIAGQSSNGVTIRDEISTGVTVNKNEFCLNEDFGVENQGITALDATNNWWGAFDGPAGSGSGGGDAVSAGVDFSLFETTGLIPGSQCTPESLCVADGDVNADGVLTPGDALAAFEIFLNGEVLPPKYDVPDFVCEVKASDANCNGSVTPGDALAIFEGFLDGNDPNECMGQKILLLEGNQVAKLGKTYEIALEQQAFVPSQTDGKGRVEVALMVKNPEHLRTFGATISFPKAFSFIGMERSEVTADWQHIDAVSNAQGEVTVGGFSATGSRHTKQGELVKLLFEYQSDSFDSPQIAFSRVYDDFSGAVVESGTIEIAQLPEQFALRQNYPNPFNPETQIQFEIPKTSDRKVDVAVTIYNLKGQVVRSLVSEKKAPGVYRVKWDGKNDNSRQVTSGTYFYSIKAGSFKDTKKMLLVK